MSDKPIVPYKTHEVTVLYIANPFNAAEHAKDVVRWEPEKPLRDYLHPGVDLERYHVAVNGEITTDFNAPIENNSIIALTPILGDSSDEVIHYVGKIVVAAASIYLAAMGGWAIVAAAAVQIGGSYLINEYAPLPVEGADGNSSDRDPSTYGVDGAKNTSKEGVTVPICYGKFRMGGNIIGMHSETDESTNNQTIYMLLNAGEGRISNITDIQINDQPATEGGTKTDYIRGFDYKIRRGLPHSAVMHWFDDVVTPFNKGVTLNTEYYTMVTSKPVDKIRLDLLFPRGLYRMNDKGKKKEETVNLIIGYRRVGDTNWNTAGNVTNIAGNETWYEINGEEYATLPSGYQTELETYVYYYFGGMGQNEREIVIDSNGNEVGRSFQKTVYTYTSRYTEKFTSAIRRSVTIEPEVEDYYEVRIRRQTEESVDTKIADEVQLADFNEILTDNVAYRNTALLAVKVELTDQLNRIPKVTYLNHGRIIDVYHEGLNRWVERASSNPAWIVLDLMTNTRYGAGIPISRIDTLAIREWAKFCDANELEFNGVISSQSNLWDVIKPVLVAGRGQILPVGSYYTFVIDGPAEPSMMFGSGNIMEGSMEISWAGIEDRANAIEVSYYPRANENKKSYMKVYDSQRPSAQEERVSKIELLGVDNKNQARDYATLLLRKNRYIKQNISFEAPVESIAATVGSVVLVQHDMPQWGYGGRIMWGTQDEVRLDRPVTMESGKTYSLLIHQDSWEIATGTVSAVNGTAVSLSGFTYYDGAEPHRVIISGVDYEVVGSFDGGSYSDGVYVRDATGIATGASFSLHRVDFIDEVTVETSPGESQILSLATGQSLRTAPKPYANFLFGEMTVGQKPFRIKSIEGSDPYVRAINATEYVEEIYDLSNAIEVPPPNYSDLSTSVRHAIVTAVTEEVEEVGTIKLINVTAAISSADDNYRYAEVWVSKNSGEYKKVGEGKSEVEFQAKKGDILRIKAVSVDDLAHKSPLSEASIYEHIVQGDAEPALPIENLVVTADRSGSLHLTWTAGDNSDLLRYEVYGSHEENDQSKSVLIGQPTTEEYTHIGLSNDVTVYYWVRMLDTSGNYSPYFPSDPLNGIGATTLDPSVQDQLAALTDSITETQLYSSLNRRIDLIDSPDVGLVTSLDDIANDVSLLGDAINRHVLSLDDNQERVNVIERETERVSEENSEMNTVISTQAVKFANAEAVLTEKGVTFASEEEAFAEGFRDLYVSNEGLAAGISSVEEARVAEDEALSRKADTLYAHVGITDAPAYDPAVTYKKDDTVVYGGFLYLCVTTSAGITNVTPSTSSPEWKLAQSVISLITQESETRATEDSALASNITTLQATVDDNSAAISSESTTRANEDSALASNITTLQASVDDQTAAVAVNSQAVADIDGTLSASHEVKVDVDGLVGGYGLINDGTVIDFGIRADRFWIAEPGLDYIYQDKSLPFIISGGKTYIDEAFIRDAAIDTLKIGSNQVTVPEHHEFIGYRSLYDSYYRTALDAYYYNDLDETVPVMVSWFMRFRRDGTTGDWRPGVFVDGVDLLDGSPTQTGFPAGSFRADVGPNGTLHVSLQGQNKEALTPAITMASVSFLGVKR